VAVADFRATAACGPAAIARSGFKHQFCGEAWQAIRRLGKQSIFDDQVLAFNPAAFA
jgi:hypothetical protein